MLGADPTWSPEQVAELFGEGYGDNPSKRYWQPDAGILVHVAAGSYYGHAGDLYRVASSTTGIP